MVMLGIAWLLVCWLSSQPITNAEPPPLQQFIGLTKEKVSLTWQDIGAATYQLSCQVNGSVKVQQAHTTVQTIDITTLIDSTGNWSCSLTGVDANGNMMGTDTRSFGVWESSPGVLELLFKVGP